MTTSSSRYAAFDASDTSPSSPYSRSTKPSSKCSNKWEIVLVLIIVAAGVVITTIAAIKAKEKSDNGFNSIDGDENLVNSANEVNEVTKRPPQVRTKNKDHNRSSSPTPSHSPPLTPTTTPAYVSSGDNSFSTLSGIRISLPAHPTPPEPIEPATRSSNNYNNHDNNNNNHNHNTAVRIDDAFSNFYGPDYDSEYDLIQPKYRGHGGSQPVTVESRDSPVTTRPMFTSDSSPDVISERVEHLESSATGDRQTRVKQHIYSAPPPPTQQTFDFFSPNHDGLPGFPAPRGSPSSLHGHHPNAELAADGAGFIVDDGFSASASTERQAKTRRNYQIPVDKSSEDEESSTKAWFFQSEPSEVFTPSQASPKQQLKVNSKPNSGEQMMTIHDQINSQSNLQTSARPAHHFPQVSTPSVSSQSIQNQHHHNQHHNQHHTSVPIITPIQIYLPPSSLASTAKLPVFVEDNGRKSLVGSSNNQNYENNNFQHQHVKQTIPASIPLGMPVAGLIMSGSETQSSSGPASSSSPSSPSSDSSQSSKLSLAQQFAAQFIPPSFFPRRFGLPFNSRRSRRSIDPIIKSSQSTSHPHLLSPHSSTSSSGNPEFSKRNHTVVSHELKAEESGFFPFDDDDRHSIGRIPSSIFDYNDYGSSRRRSYSATTSRRPRGRRPNANNNLYGVGEESTHGKRTYGILGSGNFEVIRGGIFGDEDSASSDASYSRHKSTGGGEGSGGDSDYDDATNIKKYSSSYPSDDDFFARDPVLGFQGYDNFQLASNQEENLKKDLHSILDDNDKAASSPSGSRVPSSLATLSSSPPKMSSQRLLAANRRQSTSPKTTFSSPTHNHHRYSPLFVDSDQDLLALS